MRGTAAEGRGGPSRRRIARTRRYGRARTRRYGRAPTGYGALPRAGRAELGPGDALLRAGRARRRKHGPVGGNPGAGTGGGARGPAAHAAALTSRYLPPGRIPR